MQGIKLNRLQTIMKKVCSFL